MTYSEFLVELVRLIDGDESSPTDLPVGTLRQIIELGERRIYSDVRSRYNVKAWSDESVVVTSNLASLPADFESVDIIHFGKWPLKPIPEDVAVERLYGENAGDSIYFAQAGSDLTFFPAAEDATALQGRYFCRLPGLDAATAPTNALFDAERDLFTYAALIEAVPIFKKFNELGIWEGKYRSAVDRVNKRHAMAAYSAGRMQVRPSTRLMR